MGLINWIFDIYQHTRIDDARREAAEARAEVAAIRQQAGGGVDSARLVRAIEELALSTKTLQRLLVDKGVCTQAEMAALLRKVDLEDGVADGRTPLL